MVLVVEPEIQFAGRQVVGRRERQEDCYAFCEWESETPYDPLIGAIADGMGGEEDGDVASTTALRAFLDGLSGVETDEVPNGMTTSLLEANRELANTLDTESFAGTTLVGFCVIKNKLHWISVGDSYLLLFRDGKLRQLNEDHSARPDLVSAFERGEITQEELDTHPDRSALKSYVAGIEIPMIDQSEEPFDLRDGDILVVATDGIDEIVQDESLEHRMDAWKDEDAASIADRIIDAVEDLKDDYQDNTSVMVVKVVEGGGK